MNISQLSGVGAKRAHSLYAYGIATVANLLNHFPRDYDDRSQIKDIRELTVDATNTIRGVVATAPTVAKLMRKRAAPLNIIKLTLKDTTGTLEIVWFNQPYLKKYFKVNSEYLFTGKVRESFGGKLQMQAPEYEPAHDNELSHGRIVPVYTTPPQYSQKTFRTLIHQALSIGKNGDAFMEDMPLSVRQKYNLCKREDAIEHIHFPASDQLFLDARRRLVFEELFFMQSSLLHMKEAVTCKPGITLTDTALQPFLLTLPFPLTNAQAKVLDDIASDMGSGKCMNRLVQGDVGSGKTVVAMAAAYLVIKSGYQTALMAPTEVLANQHYKQCQQYFGALGFNTVLLTGSLGAKAKREALAKIADGSANMIIGTHALIQEKVEYAQLGLAITDEQHRFGVNQRLTLIDKGSERNDAKMCQDYFKNTHTLVMTATPIPRTLGLILYGDLDISIINELPPGRQEIKTYSVNSKYRERLHAFIRKEVEAGRQVYVICPAIDQKKDETELDEKLAEDRNRDANEMKNVLAYTNELSVALPDISIRHLHGKMKPQDKQDIMDSFKGGSISVLVSTTVIEVGVHVANATLMIVENAERFGLSQLHQLRGRVGRGKDQSYCVLVTDGKAAETKERMKAMCDTADGFKLAELDLKLRGAGDFFGTRQHGLPSFTIANLYRDMDVLKEVQQALEEVAEKRLAISAPEAKQVKSRIAKVLSATYGGVM